MSSVAQTISGSGSEGNTRFAVVDERKKRRMLLNRESAKRSRLRKQKHIDDLINQVAQLQNQNAEIMKHVNGTTQLYVHVESENSILRGQMMELSDRLQSMNNVLHIAEEVSGLSMDIHEVPDPLLKPWQLPCPSQPIMASANMNMFQF